MKHLAESVCESESALDSFQNAATDLQQAANDLHGEIMHFKLGATGFLPTASLGVSWYFLSISI